MQTAAQLVVKCLEAHGVEFVFGIPGAKIDGVFNALNDSSIRLIICRHEQNAAFMAAAYGRLTGKPGVVLVTSGPGVANLATGLLTATTEGDPLVALGGSVSRSSHLREAHQNVNNVELMEPVTKSSTEVTSAENISEAITNAFRAASTLRRGASFISLPQDVLAEKTAVVPIKNIASPMYGAAHSELIIKAAKLINAAKMPVFLLGQEASRAENAKVIRTLLHEKPFPVVGTFQAAGTIPRDLQYLFIGRVGLFKNQPGDVLLEQADVVVTVGYNPVEYDPEIWNRRGKATVIHLAYRAADIHLTYQPEIELIGEIAETIKALQPQLVKRTNIPEIPEIKRLHDALFQQIEHGKSLQGKNGLIHPLRFIHELRTAIDDEVIIMCDIGTVYMWMARYFMSYEPRHLLFSNGQQTLGVALPWAIAAKLAYPHKKIISISGDGGFLFSSMELETAVREKCNFVHFVWTDGSYNMVLEQEVIKYKRKSGVELGTINLLDYAHAFGAKGFELTKPEDFSEILQEAFAQKCPVLINVPIDYSENPGLFIDANPNSGN